MDTKDAPQIINHSSASVSYVPHASRWLPHSICCFAGGEAPKRTGELEIYKLQEGQLKRQQHKETETGIKCMDVAQSPAGGHLLLSGKKERDTPTSSRSRLLQQEQQQQQ